MPLIIFWSEFQEKMTRMHWPFPSSMLLTEEEKIIINVSKTKLTQFSGLLFRLLMYKMYVNCSVLIS
jgi:hypothetical protein